MSGPVRLGARTVVAEGIQYEGGAASATPIINWLLDLGLTATWDEAHEAWTDPEDPSNSYDASPEALRIRHNNGETATVPEGSWVIVNSYDTESGSAPDFHIYEDPIVKNVYVEIS